jgi:uncharacterized protein YlaI
MTPFLKNPRLWGCGNCRINGCLEHGPQKFVLCYVCYGVNLCPECATRMDHTGPGKAYMCNPCKERKAEEVLTIDDGGLTFSFSVPEAENGTKITMPQSGVAKCDNGQLLYVRTGDVLQWNGNRWRVVR